MNKIEKLIKDFCPDGVEFRSLKSVANSITTGKLNANAQVEDGEYPFFTCDANPFKIDVYAFDVEAIIVSGNGSQVGHINYYHGKFNAYQRTYVISEFNDINVRYLLHFLKGYLREYIFTNSRKGSVPYITMPMLENFIVPIPPLVVQKEIVKILDNFTALEAGLEAELEGRRKQYEYYRNELLTFTDRQTDRTRWVMLNEIIDFMNGKGHEKDIDENGKYVVVNSKFVSTEGKVKKYSARQICPILRNDILMVMSDLPNGKALAKCFYVDEDDKYTLNQRICALTVKDDKDLNAKYLFYVLNRNRRLLKYDNGADQTNLRKNDILEIKVPIPTMSEQERIVDILDKFDALVNDISIGLPAELNARRKQYEFYRDQLLTFKSLEMQNAN